MDNGFWIVAVATCILLVLLILACRRSHGSSGKVVASVKRKSSVARSWIPGNLIEEKLQSYRDQKIGRSAFISALVASELFILTDGEGKTDPRDCDSIPRIDRSRLIPIYTSLYQLRQHLKSNEGAYTHIQIVKMRTWIPLLPRERGLIINPEHESAVEILPDDIEQLKLELS